jgi:hypothetical protein
MVFAVMLGPCKSARSWPQLMVFLLMAIPSAYPAEWVQRPAPSGPTIGASASPLKQPKISINYIYKFRFYITENIPIFYYKTSLLLLFQETFTAHLENRNTISNSICKTKVLNIKARVRRLTTVLWRMCAYWGWESNWKFVWYVITSGTNWNTILYSFLKEVPLYWGWTRKPFWHMFIMP